MSKNIILVNYPFNVEGSVSEREQRKWEEKAVKLEYNPYSTENITRRMSGRESLTHAPRYPMHTTYYLIYTSVFLPIYMFLLRGVCVWPVHFFECFYIQLMEDFDYKRDKPKCSINFISYTRTQEGLDENFLLLLILRSPSASNEIRFSFPLETILIPCKRIFGLF